MSSTAWSRHFSGSRLGRVLGRLQHAIEERYCERVVAAPGSLGHLRQLRQRLHEGVLVSEYFDVVPGGRNVEAPFLDGRLLVGTQAPRLAQEAGVPLLPVFPLADGPDTFRIVVEPPVALEAGARRVEAATAAVRAQVRRLEWYALRYPDQWQGWTRVRLATGTAPP